MGYRLLGKAIWKGAIWYVRRQHPQIPRRKIVLAGVVGAGIAAIYAASRR